MTTTGVILLTVVNPSYYTSQQLDEAAGVAAGLHRGPFILCTTPER